MDDELNPDENSASSEEEQKNNISSDLIRGHINTIILRTLYERDKYGYEIIEEIEAKSHGQYTLKQPTLYSALKRLESQGYINAYWKTDEVSQGGRRKYYTLTDSGREISERNQAEWEYSRTVIDNLISDRNFDFSQPAPNPVDFKLLKKYTSRVPLVKDESDDDEDEKEVEKKQQSVPPAPVVHEQPAAQPVQPVVQEQPAQPTAPVTEQPVQPAQPVNAAPAAEQVPAQPVQNEQPAQPVQTEPQMSEEQRRILHENYLRLISQPVVEKQETPPTPYSENIDTDKLIYNNKPETERDYRNLVNNLYLKTVRQQPAAQPAAKPAPVYVEKREPAQPVNRYEDAHAKAEKDGLTLNTDYSVQNPRKKKYNRGATLFKCSLIVAVAMLLEFALCLIFKSDLGVGIGYPMVILALTCAQVLIFGILFYNDRGKTTRKPSTLTYLSASFIVTVILILIICVVSLLLNVNFASAGDICAKIVIPCFVALNVPAFSVLFYVFSK